MYHCYSSIEETGNLCDKCLNSVCIGHVNQYKKCDRLLCEKCLDFKKKKYNDL